MVSVMGFDVVKVGGIVESKQVSCYQLVSF